MACEVRNAQDKLRTNVAVKDQELNAKKLQAVTDKLREARERIWQYEEASELFDKVSVQQPLGMSETESPWLTLRRQAPADPDTISGVPRIPARFLESLQVLTGTYKLNLPSQAL